MFRFDHPDFEETTAREWLVTNGLGGYASATLSGANTRRYHGLLVAALDPPANRKVLVSKIEEKLNGFPLSANRFPGVIHPEGHQYLESFERDPLPRSVYRIPEGCLSKTVFMVHGMNATIVSYRNEGHSAVHLELMPLLVFRDFHTLFKADPEFDFYTEQTGTNRLKVYPCYGAQPLFIGFSDGEWAEKQDWYRNFEYGVEQERGLDYREDAKSIGAVNARVEPGEAVHLVFSLDQRAFDRTPEAWKKTELSRLQELRPKGAADPFLADLLTAGDQFIVSRQSTESYSVIAGYHWFADWGRDTMIAMRGLTVASGRQDISRSILRTFLKYLDGGMLPNRFPEQGGKPEYNSIDASLWLFVVLYEYHQQFRDTDFLEEVFPKLTDILEGHIHGTRYRIHETDEGLLFGGEGRSQLTWMDARVGDHAVTPRQGCPVEINALWYNALNIYLEFAGVLNKEVFGFDVLAKKVRKAFRQYFINEKGYLNDAVVPNESIDDTIRPNQLYALSLPFGLLTEKESRSVMAVIEQQLYTGLGLRSLSPDHPDFKGIYQGDQRSRDMAYHQGTVWAFLWPEYALARLKLDGYSVKSQQVVRDKMAALKAHFYESGCVYGIAEIFDGADPGPAKGCIQQAWSVGMLIKVLLEMAQKGASATGRKPVKRNSGRKAKNAAQ